MKKQLNPWLTGAIISFLFASSIYFINEPIGGLRSYFDLYINFKQIFNGQSPQFNWQILFLLCVLIGGILAAALAKEYKFEPIPEEHLKKGPQYYLIITPLTCFVGGLLVMSGLIIAGGSFIDIWRNCMNLNLVTLVFLVVMFVEAILLGTILTLKVESKK